MKKVLHAFAALALLITAMSARGDEAPAPAAAAAAPATPPPPKWYDTFEIHGLVDSYAAVNGNVAQDRSNGPLHAFDSNNGFQLAFAKLTAQLAAEPAGFRIDLGTGQVASILNNPLTSTIRSVGDVTVEQAYASIKVPADIVIDMGRFVTAAGAEVIEAKDNLLYSRSILFYSAIPFTHVGLRATIPIKSVEGLSIMASLFNGWDSPPNAVGSSKAAHVALLYSGPSSTTVALNVIYGDVNNNDRHERLLVDLVLGRAFGDLTLSINGDVGTENSQTYAGVAVAGRYSLAGDKVRIAARGEYFSDSDGLALGVASGSYYEGTLGLGIPVGKNVEVRLEAREDASNDNNPILNGKKSQFIGELAALAWF